MKDPREKREFTDFSDYPQDGYGNLDADKDFDEVEEDEEDIPLEEDDD